MAAKVFDGFFLGNAGTSMNAEFLRNNRITKLVNVAGEDVDNVNEGPGYTYETYNWQDQPDYNVFPNMENDRSLISMVTFIDNTLKSGLSILVFSLNGLSRSIFAVCAYLMYKYHWGFEKCYDFIMSKKDEIQMNHGFVTQLLALEVRLLTRRNEWLRKENRNLDGKDTVIIKTENERAKEWDPLYLITSPTSSSYSKNDPNIDIALIIVGESSDGNFAIDERGDELILINTFLNSKNTITCLPEPEDESMDIDNTQKIFKVKFNPVREVHMIEIYSSSGNQDDESAGQLKAKYDSKWATMDSDNIKNSSLDDMFSSTINTNYIMSTIDTSNGQSVSNRQFLISEDAETNQTLNGGSVSPRPTLTRTLSNMGSSRTKLILTLDNAETSRETSIENSPLIVAHKHTTSISNDEFTRFAEWKERKLRGEGSQASTPRVSFSENSPRMISSRSTSARTISPKSTTSISNDEFTRFAEWKERRRLLDLGCSSDSTSSQSPPRTSSTTKTTRTTTYNKDHSTGWNLSFAEWQERRKNPEASGSVTTGADTSRSLTFAEYKERRRLGQDTSDTSHDSAHVRTNSDMSSMTYSDWKTNRKRGDRSASFNEKSVALQNNVNVHISRSSFNVNAPRKGSEESSSFADFRERRRMKNAIQDEVTKNSYININAREATVGRAGRPPRNTDNQGSSTHINHIHTTHYIDVDSANAGGNGTNIHRSGTSIYSTSTAAAEHSSFGDWKERRRRGTRSRSFDENSNGIENRKNSITRSSFNVNSLRQGSDASTSFAEYRERRRRANLSEGASSDSNLSHTIQTGTNQKSQDDNHNIVDEHTTFADWRERRRRQSAQNSAHGDSVTTHIIDTSGMTDSGTGDVAQQESVSSTTVNLKKASSKGDRLKDNVDRLSFSDKVALFNDKVIYYSAQKERQKSLTSEKKVYLTFVKKDVTSGESSNVSNMQDAAVASLTSSEKSELSQTSQSSVKLPTRIQLTSSQKSEVSETSQTSVKLLIRTQERACVRAPTRFSVTSSRRTSQVTTGNDEGMPFDYEKLITQLSQNEKEAEKEKNSKKVVSAENRLLNLMQDIHINEASEKSEDKGGSNSYSTTTTTHIHAQQSSNNHPNNYSAQTTVDSNSLHAISENEISDPDSDDDVFSMARVSVVLPSVGSKSTLIAIGKDSNVVDKAEVVEVQKAERKNVRMSLHTLSYRRDTPIIDINAIHLSAPGGDKDKIEAERVAAENSKLAADAAGAAEAALVARRVQEIEDLDKEREKEKLYRKAQRQYHQQQQEKHEEAELKQRLQQEEKKVEKEQYDLFTDPFLESDENEAIVSVQGVTPPNRSIRNLWDEADNDGSGMSFGLMTDKQIHLKTAAAPPVTIPAPAPAPIVVVKREPINLDACMDPMPVVKVRERAPKTAKPLGYGNGNKLIIIDGDEPELLPEIDYEVDIYDDLVGESITVKPSPGRSSMNFAPNVSRISIHFVEIVSSKSLIHSIDKCYTMMQMGSIDSIRFAAPAAVPAVVKAPLDTRTIASKESVQTVFTKREIVVPVKAAVVAPVPVPVPVPVPAAVATPIVQEKKEIIATIAEKAPVTVISIKPREVEKDKGYFQVFQGVKKDDDFSLISRDPTPENSQKDKEPIKLLAVQDPVSEVIVHHNSSRAYRDISLLNTVTDNVEFRDLMQDTPINTAVHLSDLDTSRKLSYTTGYVPHCTACKAFLSLFFTIQSMIFYLNFIIVNNM